MGKDSTHFDIDKLKTLKNRESLMKNRNLLLWYNNLYIRQFQEEGDISQKTVLEIGSGTSPLKLFYPNVLTSDIMDLDYLDYRFDCQEIDTFSSIPDTSVDIITLTNVLHHLKHPIDFLLKAACKLKPGGRIIIAEPYFSFSSWPIYKLLHHEPSDFSITEPVLDEIKGPLSTANMAIPYMLFFKREDWRSPLNALYDVHLDRIEHYSAISYMMTGGISQRIPIPHSFYKIIVKFDFWIAHTFPQFFSAFFILKITKKE